MASLAAFVQPFIAAPSRSAVRQAAFAGIESVSFTHAFVSLAAKLAAVDGTPNKAELGAFHTLFEGDEAQLRNLFIKQVTDSSSALQYAREIASMSRGEGELHLDIMQRLLRIATADAAINAAELEFLRAVANIFAIDRSAFRTMIARTIVPQGASPYEILGISSRVSDGELRDHYMERVRMLHPDRYHAAGASAETIAVLSDQLAAVNAAYQSVQRTRAKKSTRSDTTRLRWWSRLNAKGARV